MHRHAITPLALALMALAAACTPDETTSPPPQVEDASWTVAEHRPAGTLVGTLDATIAEGRTGTFRITQGDEAGVFALDAAGRLTVANTEALDFETSPSFTLLLEVTDDATSPGTGSAELTVTLTDVNEAPTLEEVTFNLSEKAEQGAVIGTFAVTEPDAGQVHAFAIIDGNEGDTFAVSATGGVLTLASTALLDFETTPVFTLTVRVTDSGNPALSDEATITINVVDKVEPPVLSGGPYSLDENVPEGSLVGTLTVVEGTGDLTFELIGGNTGGAFALDAATGALVVANPQALDFEVTPAFTLAARVTDAEGLSSSVPVEVSLNDVNERPTLSGGPFTLAENSAAETIVGSLTATDVDAGQNLTLAIVGGNDLGAFTLSGLMLVVANPAALDFETRSSFELLVRATDDGDAPLSVDHTLLVELTDRNDAPTVTGGSFSLAENSAAGTEAGVVPVTDDDAGQTATLSIEAGDDQGRFVFLGNRLVVAEGAVLDFEATPALALTVRATDDGSPPAFSSAQVLVQLVDQNEAPLLSDVALTVNENATPGDEVGVLTAVDPDEGQSLLFELIAGNDGNTFALDPSTGALTVMDETLLDFELRTTFTLTVQVTDDATPGLSATRVFTVSVVDVGEPPTLGDATFTLDENAAADALVGTLTAADPDEDAVITYALETGHDGIFALSGNGRVTVADTSALDFETSPSFALAVRATDETGLFAQATVTVTLRDVNEAPFLSADTTSANVPEDATAGTRIVKLTTSDVDAGQTVSLAIQSGNTGSAFALSDGWLVVGDLTALDFEQNPSFSLTLRAADDGSPALHTDLAVAIDLDDVNEAPAVTVDQTFSVPSNASVGQTVGHLAATDPDAGQALSWTFSGGGSADGYFGLEASTGRLYVATLTTAAGSLSEQIGQSRSLSVRVADNGSPQGTGVGTVTAEITGVSVPPSAGTLNYLVYTDGLYTMNIGEQASLGTPTAQVVTFGGGVFGTEFFPAGNFVEVLNASLKVDANGTISTASQQSDTLTFTVRVENAAGSADLEVNIVFCVALEPGAVAHYYEQSQMCLKGGAEYVLVPTNLASSGTTNLTVKATGIVPVVGAPSPIVSPLAGALTLNTQQGPAGSVEAPVLDESFDERLRRMEQETLAPLMAGARAARLAGPNLNIVPGVPSVGSFMTLNTADEPCSVADNRVGRVEAVSTHAIVVDEWKADKSGPVVPNAFTEAHFQQIAQKFDDEIFPLISSTFGMPQDIDSNARIVIFYTSAVNQLTPPGSSSYIGGFVHSRDVLPTASCATSNVGEMFYMLSPDPDALFGNERSVDFVLGVTFGTLAHEFQHLINASRRVYVNGASVFETVWLNEGLSHIAEELMFHAAAGIGPGQNVDLDDVISTQPFNTAFNTWAISNLARLDHWLSAPHADGPFAANDTLATRGAIWAFLRYAADRRGGDQSAMWAALVNSATAGLDNLDAVLEDHTIWWVSDFTHAMYLDDTGIVVEPNYTQPSWNFRSIYPAMSTVYPLAVRDAVEGVDETIALNAGGGAAYVRLGVAAGDHALLTLQSGTAPPPGTVELSLIRRK